MKYIITETKYDHAFQKVIDSFIGKLKKPYLEKVVSSGNRFIYENENGIIIFIVLEGYGSHIEIHVNDEIYSTTGKLMSEKKSKKLQEQFIEWIKNNLGIKFDEVHTFDDPDYVY